MKRPRQPSYKRIFAGNAEMQSVAIEAWGRAMDHLEENSLLTPSRANTADRYARAVAEYEFHYPQAASEGPVKVGPNGGDVFNYIWSAVEKLNDRIARLEDMLLISPKAAGGKVEGKPAAPSKTAADEFLNGRPN